MPNLSPQKRVHCIVHFGMFLLITSCSPKYPVTSDILPAIITNDPDYSHLYFWAAHPDKKDPSDSVPQPLNSETKSDDADVFFLHPTTFTTKTLALLTPG